MIQGIEFEESQERSFVKSLTFRVLTVIADLIITYLFTHKLASSIILTVLINAAGMILYFFHERLWNFIGWGRRRRQ